MWNALPTIRIVNIENAHCFNCAAESLITTVNRSNYEYVEK